MTKEDLFKIIKQKTHWYNKSYSGYPIGLYQQGMAIAREGILNPFALNYGLFFENYSLKDHMDWFWDVEHMKEKRKQILDHGLTNPNFAEEILLIGEINHKKFVDYNNEIDNLVLPSLTNKQLKDIFKKLADLLIEVSVWSYAVDAFLSDGEEDWLEILIKQELGSKATPEIIELLTAPTFSSFVNEAEILFFKIALAVKDDKQKIVDELTLEYIKKYFWIRSNYKEYKRVDSSVIIEEVKTWLEKNKNIDVLEYIKSEEQRITNNIVSKTKICEDLMISDKLRKTLRLSEVFTHLQDNRKARVLRMNTLFFEFVAETQKRFSIPDPLGFYLITEEVFELYESKKVDLSLLQDRYNNGFLLLFFNDSSAVLSAKEFKELNLDKNFFHKHENIKEFKGTIAFKGLVSGKARVLQNAQQISTFNEGEILVANQTTPEYVPAMKKASAIITDQGGITCHAAIVARELKIPTIIGTKIATKVLKDGDTVEVDANNGIVKIL